MMRDRQSSLDAWSRGAMIAVMRSKCCAASPYRVNGIIRLCCVASVLFSHGKVEGEPTSTPCRAIGCNPRLRVPAEVGLC
jgi:hypothetical protein